jgi:hypothetical protein
MTREEWRSANRSARIRRRRDGAALAPEADIGPLSSRTGARRRAAWAFTAVALFAAAFAFWRMAPSEQHGQALAVSVPAASTPAAAEAPVPS